MIPHSKPTLGYEEFRAIKKVFYSGMIAAGEEVMKFKKKFSNYIGKEYVEFFSSGTNAFYNILVALDVREKDEILIPAYICNSVEKAILKANAKPVYYDNAPNSWISSYDEIKKKITKNTKAILINHTFGIRYERDEILKIKALGTPIIEDNAHFISKESCDIEISDMFIASFYSFDATKLLTTGNGGAVATNNKELFKNLEPLDKGFSDLNAALGMVQLDRFDLFLQKREEIAEIYFKELGKIAKELKGYDSIYFRFPIFVDKDEIFLKSKRVAFRKGVDRILRPLPNALEVFKKTISVPIYPSLSNKEIEIIISEIKNIFGEIKNEN